MGLISFKSYRESSATTRNKAAAAKGLQPLYSADVFGHATPPPEIAEKLLKKLKKKKKDKKVSEGKIQRPDYSFDSFIKNAEKAAVDTNKELQQAEKEADKIEKTSKKTKDEKEKLLDKADTDLKPKPFPPVRLNADKTLNVKDDKKEKDKEDKE